jgi:uncharacterized membrane protein
VQVADEGGTAIIAAMLAPQAISPERARPSKAAALALVLTAGALIGLWLYATPAGLLGKADAIAYAVCHRIDLRSFHIADRALPLCARCTGMYLGAMLTLGFYGFAGRRRSTLFPPWPIIAVMAVFVLAFAVDGINSYLHLFPSAPGLYQPSNTLRLITGTLFGIALGTLVLPGFNQSAWRDCRPEAALRSFAELGLILLLAAGAVLLVLSGNPLILYPLAIVSSLSVMILLTAVYTMLTLIVTHRENQATSWRDLTLPLLGGFVLALAQIAALDLVRFLLTGTWGGLSL